MIKTRKPTRQRPNKKTAQLLAEIEQLKNALAVKDGECTFHRDRANAIVAKYNDVSTRMGEACEQRDHARRQLGGTGVILKHLSVTLQNVFHLLRLPGVSENTDGKAVKAGAIAILSDIDNSIRTLLSSAFAPPTAATA